MSHCVAFSFDLSATSVMKRVASSPSRGVRPLEACGQRARHAFLHSAVRHRIAASTGPRTDHRVASRRTRREGPVARDSCVGVRNLDARAAAVGGIDSGWLAAEPLDTHAGTDTALSRIVQAQWTRSVRVHQERAHAFAEAAARRYIKNFD